MTKHSISIVIAESTEIVEFELCESEELLLNQFLNNYEKLRETSIVKSGFLSYLNINIEGNVFSSNTQIPSTESISAFLHRVRPFILQNEPACYGVITSLLKQKIANVHVKNLIKAQAKIYSGKSIPEKIQIFSNGIPIFTESSLYKWLNAFEYHQDKEKRVEVELLFKNIGGLNTANAVNLMLLAEKIKAISCIVSLVRTLFERAHVFNENA